MNNAEEYSSDLIKKLLGEISPMDQLKTDKKMLLASRIYKAMKAKGWNQKTFADKIRAHQSEVTKWLSGTHNFTAETLFDIEEVLGIELIRVRQQSIIQVNTLNITVSSKEAEALKFSSWSNAIKPKIATTEAVEDRARFSEKPEPSYG